MEKRFEGIPPALPTTRPVANERDPQLFEFVICPNQKCSKHVELSTEDRQLASIAQLACQSCNTNLAGALDASMGTN